jgi:hypothetical protein
MIIIEEKIIDEKYNNILKKLNPTNELEENGLETIADTYNSFEAYPTYMPQQSFEQTYDSYEELSNGKFILTHAEYVGEKALDEYTNTYGIIDKKELEIVTKYWKKLLNKNEQEFENEFYGFNDLLDEYVCEEKNFETKSGYYVHFHPNDEGYDFSYYDSAKVLIDGGILLSEDYMKAKDILEGITHLISRAALDESLKDLLDIRKLEEIDEIIENIKV